MEPDAPGSLPRRIAWPAGEDAEVAAILTALEAGGSVTVGPGHDCALVTTGSHEVVVTCDVLVDGRHFLLGECGPEAAGEKALLVNLSDLAAAGATPLAFEVGLVLPRGAPRDLPTGLARGLARAARRYGCPCAGGDTNVAGAPLVVAVTALGRPGPQGVVTRRGALVGDELSVTGPLGGSSRGRHLAFVPRLVEGRTLAERGVAHAMMDLSDGLSRDLPRLCRASGVGARIVATAVPVHPDVQGLDDARSPLEHALDDGEDFELLVAHAPLTREERAALASEGVQLVRVGDVRPASEGVRLSMGSGSLPLAPRGFDHFTGGDR